VVLVGGLDYYNDPRVNSTLLGSEFYWQHEDGDETLQDLMDYFTEAVDELSEFISEHGG
jgi:hypothetical protein